MTPKPHSTLAEDFEIVRQGLVRDGHDRFAALRRIEERLKEESEQKWSARKRAQEAEDRVSELEAALEIEREGNPHRVYCPKCQADLPCESCKRYAVALPAAEDRISELEAALESVRSERDDELLTERNRVAELEAALREIEEMERERDIYREAEEMRVIARRALGGVEE